MRLRNRIWLAVMLLSGWGASPALLAGERVYGADPVESQWQLVSDNFQCRLEHTVPQFGRAAFVQPAGGDLRFELQSWRSQQTGTVALRAIPPEWRPGFSIVELGSVPFPQADSTLRLADQRVERLLAELEEGVYPAIFYPESDSGRGGVSVVLSGVRFRAAFDAFLGCRAGLMKVDVSALRNKTVHFGTNRSELSPADRKLLAEFAGFARSSGPDKKVVVEAYADARGSQAHNKRLSKRRAEAVRDYLLSQGLDTSRIVTRTYGEDKPLASNRTETGRKQNRRVLVRMIN